MSGNSKKFSPEKWMEWLVPVLIGVLAIGLLVTIGIVVLSVLGLTPGF